MKTTIQKCPHCQNNINIEIIEFPIDNDFGGIIIECSICKKKSYTKIKNPRETYIKSGGNKIEYWDNEIQLDTDFLIKYPHINSLRDAIIVHGEINKRILSYDICKTNIYFCKQCNNSIEDVIYSILDQNFNDIVKEFSTIMNIALKGYADGKYLVVELPIKCSCGKEDKAFLYMDFHIDCNIIHNPNQFILIGTKNSINANNLDRICSKVECIEILEKFLFRWNFIYPKVLIATPFVGHQWMSEEELLELWAWILNTLDPQKTIFITRKATFNKYKKIFEKKNGFSLEFLENYDLNNKVISNYTSKQDFHAKIFAGISQENIEVLAGSFNLLKGKSVENLTYNKYDSSTFNRNFISKMNIPITIPPLENINCILIYKDISNSFKSKQIKKSEIDKQLLNLEDLY